ncbi:MAG: nucleoid-structuring protein H-NS [Bacteroidota bacterium]|jgi:hypothetical protein
MTRKMIRLLRSSSRLIVMTMIIGMVAVGSGCKSKKKAMEAAAAEKARLEQEAELKRQQEEAARREAEERARREAEERARAEAAAPRAKLEQYFSTIAANSGNVASANRSISEALTLFASDETPVLIVISESGGIKDYDRPTTIKQYLEYLKDTGKNVNRIGNIQYDSAGKITELELIK